MILIVYCLFGFFFFLLYSDMAVQNAIGDSFRGATWVALHNGGGVGWLVVISCFIKAYGKLFGLLS